MNIQEIIDKLKDIISAELPDKRIYDKDVAEALGISKESLSHIKKRGTVPLEAIAYFCAKRKISINWVLFGQFPKSLEEETEKYARIRYFSKINASAGGGSFNYDEAYELLTIDKALLERLSTKAKGIAAMNVIGDSMEPTLQDKEVILFDKENKDITKGGIFIVTTNAGLFVKRIAQKLDGSVELISDNRNYNSEIIQEDELLGLEIVGKVVGKVGVV
jgi:phage repressor protein C with HTH and peptisase S24 domain